MSTSTSFIPTPLNYPRPEEIVIIDRLFQKYPLDEPVKARLYDYCYHVLKALESTGYNQANRRDHFLTIFGPNLAIIDYFETTTKIAGGLFLFNEAIKVINQNGMQAQLNLDYLKPINTLGYHDDQNWDNLFNFKTWTKIVKQLQFVKINPNHNWTYQISPNYYQLHLANYFDLIYQLGQYGAQLLMAINNNIELKSFASDTYNLETATTNFVFEQYNRTLVPVTKRFFNIKAINPNPLNYLNNLPFKMKTINVNPEQQRLVVIRRNVDYQVDLNSINQFHFANLEEQMANKFTIDPARYQIRFNQNHQLQFYDLKLNQFTNTVCNPHNQCTSDLMIESSVDPTLVIIKERAGALVNRAKMASPNAGLVDFVNYFEQWNSIDLWMEHYLYNYLHPGRPLNKALILFNFKNLSKIELLKIDHYFENPNWYTIIDQQNYLTKYWDYFKKNKPQDYPWNPISSYDYQSHLNQYQPLIDQNKLWISSDQFISQLTKLLQLYYQYYPTIYLGKTETADQQIIDRLINYDQPELINALSLSFNKSYLDQTSKLLQTELYLENPTQWTSPHFLNVYPHRFGTHWQYNILPTASMLNFEYEHQNWTKYLKYGGNYYLSRVAQKFIDPLIENDPIQLEQFAINKFYRWLDQNRDQDGQLDYQKYFKILMFQTILEKKFAHRYDYANDQYCPVRHKPSIITEYGHYMEASIINQLALKIKNDPEFVKSHFPAYQDRINDIQVICDKRTLMFKDLLYGSELAQIVDVDGLVVDRHTKAILAIVEAKTKRSATRIPATSLYRAKSLRQEYINQISLYSLVFNQTKVIIVSGQIPKPFLATTFKEDQIWNAEVVNVNQLDLLNLKSICDQWIQIYHDYILKAINPLTNQYDKRLETIVSNAFNNGLQSSPIFDNWEEQQNSNHQSETTSVNLSNYPSKSTN